MTVKVMPTFPNVHRSPMMGDIKPDWTVCLTFGDHTFETERIWPEWHRAADVARGIWAATKREAVKSTVKVRRTGQGWKLGLTIRRHDFECENIWLGRPSAMRAAQAIALEIGGKVKIKNEPR